MIDWLRTPVIFAPSIMFIRLLVLALFLLPVVGASASDELIRQAAVAEGRQDARAALELYLHADKITPDNPDILQKIARQYSDLVDTQAGADGKKHYAEIALEYAQRAVALDPQNAVNILSVAVCYGKLALYSDIRDKVKYSRLVSEETKHALALDPNYAWAHHVLGRWNCEVAAVGTTSRFFAKLFYGDLPDASFTEGIRQLQLATKLEPDEPRHWLELGFAYLAAGKTDEARAQWTHCLSMHSRGALDDAAMRKARDELAKLK
jgi:tetratricopeptide (TPR) repeat protein